MLNLIKLLNQSEVKYLIIGSWAMLLNDIPMIPRDVDLWIDYSCKKNRELFKAFFLNIQNGEDIEGDDFYIYYKRGMYLYNFLSYAEGLEFNKAYENSEIKSIDNIKVRYLSINDIVLNKIAVNRQKDLIDVMKIKSFK